MKSVQTDSLWRTSENYLLLTWLCIWNKIHNKNTTLFTQRMLIYFLHSGIFLATYFDLCCCCFSTKIAIKIRLLVITPQSALQLHKTYENKIIIIIVQSHIMFCIDETFILSWWNNWYVKTNMVCLPQQQHMWPKS